ncbi:DUF2799 domain-containing protein [Undibacterium griseum]|uniref:DUF2799 domain-containing protein n=1 Tax=Undibacterium griseum TaxID=2762295 RepID=A0ABR6YRG6_9BURK|nr:DUF2799 domain-containing protein [Undibacterium griseum]MBC3886360.1 DUF2799 domain-containing protein [Undibacterium griseum]
MPAVADQMPVLLTTSSTARALLQRACRLVPFLLLLPLMACQSTISRMNDCQTGDWNFIGNKDGSDGLHRNYEERRQFCSSVDSSKIRPESAQQYEQGWQQGNQQFWYRLGRTDGRNALALSHYQQQAQSDQIRQKETPLNQAAYEQGWQLGNADYWQQSGHQEGLAGRKADEEGARRLPGAPEVFRADAYRQGWGEGNYAYWQQLGYQDAHQGIPDSTLSVHVKAAQSRDLLVREDAYHAGWNREITEYWKRLAWDDAVNGRDIYMRRDDAQRRGLRLDEAAYRQQWEQRLMQYWSEVGTADGDGKPFLLEQRMANARHEQVFVITQTRDLYTQAWNRQNAAYCTVENAFNWGRTNQPMAIEVCQQPLQYRLQRALMAGRDVEEIRRRQAFNHRELDEQRDRLRDIERRLARLEAEMQRNRDDKNRPNTPENTNTDRRNERDRSDLRDQWQSVRYRVDELQNREYRYQRDMEQIQLDALR